MTEESTEEGPVADTEDEPVADTEDEPVAEKLVIDDTSNFQFHAAYLKYSAAFDDATNANIQNQLNQTILELQQHQVDYPTFYRTIDEVLAQEGPRYRYHRTRIQTQRKREWRRKTRGRWWL